MKPIFPVQCIHCPSLSLSPHFRFVWWSQSREANLFCLHLRIYTVTDTSAGLSFPDGAIKTTILQVSRAVRPFYDVKETLMAALGVQRDEWPNGTQVGGPWSSLDRVDRLGQRWTDNTLHAETLPCRRLPRRGYERAPRLRRSRLQSLHSGDLALGNRLACFACALIPLSSVWTPMVGAWRFWSRVEPPLNNLGPGWRRCVYGCGAFRTYCST